MTKQPLGCQPAVVEESAVNALSSSLTGVGKEKVEALVNFIKAESPEELCTIKSRKQDTLISQGQAVLDSCRAARFQCYLTLTQTRPALLVLKFQKHS